MLQNPFSSDFLESFPFLAEAGRSLIPQQFEMRDEEAWGMARIVRNEKWSSPPLVPIPTVALVSPRVSHGFRSRAVTSPIKRIDRREKNRNHTFTQRSAIERHTYNGWFCTFSEAPKYQSERRKNRKKEFFLSSFRFKFEGFSVFRRSADALREKRKFSSSPFCSIASIDLFAFCSRLKCGWSSSLMPCESHNSSCLIV